MEKNRKKYEVGKTYGMIKILEIAQHSPRRYKCKCLSCGTEYIYQASQIQKYHDGCSICRKRRKETDGLTEIEELRKKYMKRKYGRLRVIDVFHERGMGTMVTVKCACGNIYDTRLDNLTKQGVKQCCNCQRKVLKKGERILKRNRVNKTSAVHCKQRKMNRKNKTGHTGIVQTSSGKYKAYIGFQKQKYNLGTYALIEDAITAREEAEKEMFGGFLDWYAKAYPRDWARLKPDDMIE